MTSRSRPDDGRCSQVVSPISFGPLGQNCLLTGKLARACLLGYRLVERRTGCAVLLVSRCTVHAWGHGSGSKIQPLERGPKRITGSRWCQRRCFSGWWETSLQRARGAVKPSGGAPVHEPSGSGRAGGEASALACCRARRLVQAGFSGMSGWRGGFRPSQLALAGLCGAGGGRCRQLIGSAPPVVGFSAGGKLAGTSQLAGRRWQRVSRSRRERGERRTGMRSQLGGVSFQPSCGSPVLSRQRLGRTPE